MPQTTSSFTWPQPSTPFTHNTADELSPALGDVDDRRFQFHVFRDRDPAASLLDDAEEIRVLLELRNFRDQRGHHSAVVQNKDFSPGRLGGGDPLFHRLLDLTFPDREHTDR